jgi:hypothetical protein
MPPTASNIRIAINGRGDHVLFFSTVYPQSHKAYGMKG